MKFMHPSSSLLPFVVKLSAKLTRGFSVTNFALFSPLVEKCLVLQIYKSNTVTRNQFTPKQLILLAGKMFKSILPISNMKNRPCSVCT